MARRVTVNLTDTIPARSAPTDTGRVGVALITQKGNVDTTRPVRSLDDFVRRYGGRQSYSVAYDWMDLFFREGGHEAYVTPVRGPAVATAAVNLPAATSGTALVVTAKSAGDWANGSTGGLSAQVVQGPSGATYRQVVILLGGVEVERSLEFTANTDGPAALANSDYVTITVGAGVGLVTVAAAANLTGGNLDRTNITQTQVDAALDALVRDLGSMQLAAPDWQTAACHTSLRLRSATNGRFALPDAPDASSKSSLLTLGNAGHTDANAKDSAPVLQPWLSVAGISGGAARSVPASAFVAAKIAQTDPVAGPAQAPAGRYGQATSGLVLDVKAKWSDADQADLETAGVGTIVNQAGSIFFDTNRTAVSPLGPDSEWLQMGISRYRMSLIARSAAAAAQYAHVTVTRQHIADLDRDLTGILAQDELDGQLFLDTGESAGASFIVDTSDTVNTRETIADGQMNVDVAFRPAPGADMVNLNLTLVGVADTVAS